MSNTNDKQEYIKQWNLHVNQLTPLGFGLTNTTDLEARKNNYKELKDIRERLKVLINRAADNDFD